METPEWVQVFEAGWLHTAPQAVGGRTIIPHGPFYMPRTRGVDASPKYTAKSQSCTFDGGSVQHNPRDPFTYAGTANNMSVFVPREMNPETLKYPRKTFELALRVGAAFALHRIAMAATNAANAKTNPPYFFELAVVYDDRLVWEATWVAYPLSEAEALLGTVARAATAPQNIGEFVNNIVVSHTHGPNRLEEAIQTLHRMFEETNPTRDGRNVAWTLAARPVPEEDAADMLKLARTFRSQQDLRRLPPGAPPQQGAPLTPVAYAQSIVVYQAVDAEINALMPLSMCRQNTSKTTRNQL
jgi:hypothetical protein